MLLAIDIGNTNIKLGLYEGERLAESWRLGANVSRTSDEYGLAITDFFRGRGIDTHAITDIVIASVIPGLRHTFERLCGDYFNIKPLFVGPGIKTGITIKYFNPREAGSDRIVNVLAAYKLYGGPATVVDFGTATTFSAVNAEGEFLGGVICAGIKTSGEALTQHAAQLPKFEYRLPPRVVNRATVENMQAGILYGAIGMVEYICARIKEECGFSEMKTIATGGFSELIAGGTKAIDIIDRTLTLTGLRMIYEINYGGKSSTALPSPVSPRMPPGKK
jgi:type III pantothenate kinase